MFDNVSFIVGASAATGGSGGISTTKPPVEEAKITILPKIRSAQLTATGSKITRLESALDSTVLAQPDETKAPVFKVVDKTEMISFADEFTSMSSNDFTMGNDCSFFFVGIVANAPNQRQINWNTGDRRIYLEMMTATTGAIKVGFGGISSNVWVKAGTGLTASGLNSVFFERSGNQVSVFVNGVDEGTQAVVEDTSEQYADTATEQDVTPVFGGVSNVALGSAGLMTLTTNLGDSDWWGGGVNLDTASSLAATVDGVTAGTGRMSYPVFPVPADGKSFYFKFNNGSFVFDRLVFHNRNDLAPSASGVRRIIGGRLNYSLNGTVVATEVIDSSAHVSTWTAAAGMEIDEVELVFSGRYQNFREIEIFSVVGIRSASTAIGAPSSGLTIGATHATNATSWSNPVNEANRLILTYLNQRYLRQIVITENLNPGAVNKVEVRSGNDWIEVYSRTGTLNSATGEFNNLVEVGGVMTGVEANKVSNTTITFDKILTLRSRAIRLTVGTEYTVTARNVALGSAGFMTLTTDITTWLGVNNSAATALPAIVDGVTGTSGALAYALYATGTDGRFIKLKMDAGSFVFDRLVFWNRPGTTSHRSRILGSRLNYSLNGVVVATEVIDSRDDKSTWTAAAGMTIDEVELVFSGVGQNFREIEIFGIVPRNNEIDAVKAIGYNQAGEAGLTIGSSDCDFAAALVFDRILSGEEKSKLLLWSQREFSV